MGHGPTVEDPGLRHHLSPYRGQKAALEHSTKTTADSQQACMFCARMKGNTCNRCCD